MCAVEGGHVECAKFLQENGADVNYVTYVSHAFILQFFVSVLYCY